MRQRELIDVTKKMRADVERLTDTIEHKLKVLSALLNDCDHTDGYGKILVEEGLYCSVCTKIVK